MNTEDISYVQIGEVKVSRKILETNALGSCVAAIIYDPGKRIGAMAHIMLPGKAPEAGRRGKMKYACNAVQEMLKKLSGAGARKDGLLGFIVGGGNVLRDKKDTVCKSNIRSVLEQMKAHDIEISAKSVGGTQRRSVSFDATGGALTCSKGDGRNILLWNYSG